MLGGAPCFGEDDSTPARAKSKGRVTIVYQEETIKPESRDPAGIVCNLSDDRRLWVTYSEDPAKVVRKCLKCISGLRRNRNC
jgi:hypothetical protein